MNYIQIKLKVIHKYEKNQFLNLKILAFFYIIYHSMTILH